MVVFPPNLGVKALPGDLFSPGMISTQKAVGAAQLLDEDGVRRTLSQLFCHSCVHCAPGHICLHNHWRENVPSPIRFIL